jgi:hypothetical protein
LFPRTPDRRRLIDRRHERFGIQLSKSPYSRREQRPPITEVRPQPENSPHLVGNWFGVARSPSNHSDRNDIIGNWRAKLLQADFDVDDPVLFEHSISDRIGECFE